MRDGDDAMDDLKIMIAAKMKELDRSLKTVSDEDASQAYEIISSLVEDPCRIPIPGSLKIFPAFELVEGGLKINTAIMGPTAVPKGGGGSGSHGSQSSSRSVDCPNCGHTITVTLSK